MARHHLFGNDVSFRGARIRGLVPFFSRAALQLNSDAVEWTMQIASGTTCTRGLKHGSTNITDVKLIAPPQAGKVDIKGPSFSYAAKADFQGQDEFTVQVSGAIVRIAGVSDVKVDPPPFKWSDLRYVFDIQEDCNGKEAIQA